MEGHEGYYSTKGDTEAENKIGSAMRLKLAMVQ